MGAIQDFFLCDACQNREFSIVYSFSLRFHRVNFADELIYDRLMEERFACTKCHKTFTKKEIEEGLGELKRRRKK